MYVSTRVWRVGHGGQLARLAQGQLVRWSLLGWALLVAAIGGIVIGLNRPPTAVTVEDALSHFRSTGTSSVTTATSEIATTELPPRDVPPQASVTTLTAPTTAAAAPGTSPANATLLRPDDGVYRYNTEGSGSTDALGGARHDYPRETPVTVGHTPCGYTLRWQPLRERWDEWEICLDGAQHTLLRVSTYVEFYGQRREDSYHCEQATTIPLSDQPGTQRSYVCRSGDAVLDTTATVVGEENVTVGGATVATQHMRYEVVASGSVQGTQQLDWWRHTETTLPLRSQRVADMSSDSPFGRVHYHEEFTSTASSLEAQR